MPCARTLALALCILAAACATTAEPAILDALVGTWQFTGDVPAGARIPTLSVARDGKVRGTSGVNRYTAQIDPDELAHGRFRIGPTAVTRMAGTQAAMQLEAAFLQALADADSVVRDGGLLVLKQAGQPLLQFSMVSGG